MSAENVELIRAGYAQLLQTGELDMSLIHQDVEWHVASDLPDSGVHRGIVALQTLLDGWRTAFEYTVPDVQDIFDRGEYVVVSPIWRGRIKGGGDEITMPETHVFKMRDGKAIEVREYRTLDEAFARLEDASAE